MPAMIPLTGLHYRVNHPEFEPDIAYRAIGYIDYGESSWSKLLFITKDGKTYSVKVWRCLCLEARLPGDARVSDYLWNPGLPWSEIKDYWKYLKELPWPKPKCKNPDLDDD